MLSTRISFVSTVRGIALSLALAAVAGCTSATGPQTTDNGIYVDPNKTVRVALLVPTGSGDPGQELIGRDLINAARLAQSDLRNADIDLVVYPTGGTSGGGSSAASQAIAEGARIIVGPLFSTATAGADPVAASAGVHVLSMSNNPEVANENTHILGNTFINTADSLVAYGMSRGLRNYGIVYPLGLEGETARDAAANAIQRRGADLVASEPYSLSVEAINSAAVPAAASLTSRGANAVILTDGPTGGLGYMAEALRANGVSSSQVRFFGMQRWDISAETLTLDSTQGGVFAAPDPSLVGEFNGRYVNAYGENPHELAGLAYDGINAVGTMIAQARASGGNPFSQESINQSNGFAGVQGAFRFFPDGNNQRNLAIYEVQNGTAVLTQRASRSFGSVGN